MANITVTQKPRKYNQIHMKQFVHVSLIILFGNAAKTELAKMLMSQKIKKSYEHNIRMQLGQRCGHY